MLAEGVLESAVVSGLVMEQSGQGSSFSVFFGVPPVFLFVSEIDLCCKY